MQPSATPMNNAGEKIPPNRFNLMQTTVKNNLPKRSKIIYSTSIGLSIIFLIKLVPNPKVSGKNKPNTPHIMPAIIGKS